MDEYIARNTAKRWLAFAVGTGVSAAETIDQVPAADVAPVVRCKDCKHEFGGSCIICGFQKRKSEDFCSYGERKGKNETERT